MMTTTTLHSIDRVMERCHLKNERAAEKNINKALQHGKYSENFTSWERSYLRNAAYDDCFAIAYNGFCYIVSDQGLCVTVYPLPSWFGKRKHFAGKERIRNYKKYCKSNREYWERSMVC